MLQIVPEVAREKTALRVSLPKALQDDLPLYQRALGGQEKASLNHIIQPAKRSSRSTGSSILGGNVS
jgi:hypothetical protein